MVPCSIDVVQLRFCCRLLQTAIKPPRTTQLCPGTWRVPPSKLPNISEAVKAAVQDFTGSNTTLQWGYLLDFTGEVLWQLDIRPS